MSKRNPEGTAEEHDAKKSKPDLTKPVFGSTSSFGSALSKSQSATLSFTSFGSFGLGLKFGSALERAKLKKSFLDDESEEKHESTEKEQFKQVDLAATKVKTGEEDERSCFSTTAKLFELDLTNVKSGWKERGVGPLHLNQALKDPQQVRLVMRSQGLLRVILNFKVVKGTPVLKGLEASMAPGKYARINSIVDGKPVQYLLKMSNEATRDELVETIERLQRGMTATPAREAKKEENEGEEDETEESESTGAESEKETKDEAKTRDETKPNDEAKTKSEAAD